MPRLPDIKTKRNDNQRENFARFQYGEIARRASSPPAVPATILFPTLRIYFFCIRLRRSKPGIEFESMESPSFRARSRRDKAPAIGRERPVCGGYGARTGIQSVERRRRARTPGGASGCRASSAVLNKGRGVELLGNVEIGMMAARPPFRFKKIAQNLLNKIAGTSDFKKSLKIF